MAAESDLWQLTRRHLSPFGELQRIESPLTKLGIPDVIYCLSLTPTAVRLKELDAHTGWLELKALKEWPKRTTTALVVNHLTLEQVLFAETWTRAGGTSHLLLRVGSTFLLLDPSAMRGVHERRLTRGEILTRAVASGEDRFPTAAVMRVLTKKC